MRDSVRTREKQCILRNRRSRKAQFGESTFLGTYYPINNYLFDTGWRTVSSGLIGNRNESTKVRQAEFTLSG